MLTPAGALAGEQRHHDAERAVHAGPAVVGHQVEREDRLAVRLADQVQHPGQREIVAVVGRVVLVWPVVAEAGERAVDQARVRGRERLVVAAQPLHDPGPEALHDDVGAGRELLEDGLAFRRLHVERERALVAVDVGERGAALGGRVLGLGGRRLDLQHVRAHVGEEHAGQLGGGDPRHLQHLDSVQHSHGALLTGRRRAP